MLVKKLITVAGVLGILACGACFLPERNAPPPPPLIPAMQGIKTITVVATNSSSTHHIEGDLLAAAIAKDINLLRGDTKIRARVGSTAGPADSTLSVRVLEESVTPTPEDESTPRWTFGARVSATLTRADGQILWEEKEQVHPVKQWFTTKDEAEAWKQFSKREWALPEILGPGYREQIFYGRR